MSQEKQLAFCKACKNRNMDLPHGIFCNFYGDIPEFDSKCEKFEYNEKVRIKAEKFDRKVKKKVIHSHQSRFAPVLLSVAGVLRSIHKGLDDPMGWIFLVAAVGWFIVAVNRGESRKAA